MCCNGKQSDGISFTRKLIFKKKHQVCLENGHYLDLSLHSDAEEGDEIHDKDRPEHRDVENLEKGTAEGDHLYWPLGSCKTRVDLKSGAECRSECTSGCMNRRLKRCMNECMHA